MKGRSGPLIPLQDYLRIHRVIRSALDMAEANTAHACWFFSVAGAAILRQYYKKDAFPVAGGMCLLVDEVRSDALCFATTSFHAVVVCDDHIVDFMSPIFPDVCASSGHSFAAPAKSFQRRIDSMAPSHNHLLREGDFFFASNQQLTDYLHNLFLRGHLQSDLVNVCLHWFSRPPKPIRPAIAVKDETGKAISFKLKDSAVSGAW